MLAYPRPMDPLLWQTTVSPEQARDALLINMPTDKTKEGVNALLIQGLPARAGSGGTLEDLAKYKFRVREFKNSQIVRSSHGCQQKSGLLLPRGRQPYRWPLHQAEKKDHREPCVVLAGAGWRACIRAR